MRGGSDAMRGEVGRGGWRARVWSAVGGERAERRHLRRAGGGVAFRRIASHRIASHRITSHRIASHRIASHHIALHRIASHV